MDSEKPTKTTTQDAPPSYNNTNTLTAAQLDAVFGDLDRSGFPRPSVAEQPWKSFPRHPEHVAIATGNLGVTRGVMMYGVGNNVK